MDRAKQSLNKKCSRQENEELELSYCHANDNNAAQEHVIKPVVMYQQQY